jgi:hypothetical protein
MNLKDLLRHPIDYLQAKFAPNRIVVLLTPLVFVPVSAAVSAWVAQHFPGMNLDPAVVTGFAAAGALSALTMAYRWIDGWQAEEQAFNDLYHDKEIRKLKADAE